VWFN